MNYEQAKQRAFAHGRVPDGYNGDTAEVYFTYDPDTQKTLCVCEHGYFPYHTPYANDEKEAYFLLLHHPSSNASHLSLLLRART